MITKTLRDEFAMTALIGMTNVGISPQSMGHVAKTCYEMADAMMKAREKDFCTREPD